MKKQKISTAIWIATLLLFSGLATGAPQPVIKEIRFDSSSSNIDRITFKLNGAHLPSTFALKGDRPRVIFDFPDTVPTKAVKNNITADGRYIKRIRIGIHRGDKAKTRVVFDLTSNDPVEFKQNFDAETNTLVISVFAPGTEFPSPETPEGTAREEVIEAQTVDAVEQKPEQLPEPEAVSEQEATLPPQAQDFSPTQPVVVPVQAEQEQKTVPQVEEKQGQDKQAVAPTPTPEPEPSGDMSPEEATVIQPLSEIGEQDTAVLVPPVLHAIEFDKNSNRGEIIIFKLNNFNPPVVFGIEDDIPRIVCFFKGTSAGEQLRDLINTDGRYVKTIRVGKYKNPDNIRVVMDLDPDRNYDLQQVFFKKDNMFMIIIDMAGEK